MYGISGRKITVTVPHDLADKLVIWGQSPDWPGGPDQVVTAALAILMDGQALPEHGPNVRKQLARLHVSIINEIRGMHATLAAMSARIDELQHLCMASLGVSFSNGMNHDNDVKGARNATGEQ